MQSGNPAGRRIRTTPPVRPLRFAATDPKAASRRNRRHAHPPPGRNQYLHLGGESFPLNVMSNFFATAWQPFTPQGVAAFALAPLRRLLLIQFIVALWVAAGVTWFCYDRYVPVISGAISQLPATSQIRHRQLEWHGPAPVILHENGFLAVSVSTHPPASLRSVADIQCDLGRNRLTVFSLLGYAEWPYPSGWIISLGREELEPLWGAWRPGVLTGVFVATAGGLMLAWGGLATLYAGPAWWLALYLNRRLTWRGSWKLSGAALLPGALLMLLAISFYDLGVMNLIGLLSVLGMHFFVGWVGLLLGLFATSMAQPVAARNPFAHPRKR